MDEVELGCAAHELALIEVVAHISAEHILAGIEAIEAGLAADICEEETMIRRSARRLLIDALERYEPPAMGMFLSPPAAATKRRPEPR